MIIAIVATTSAVALGLALNASRAQVKGLGRELNKAQFKLRKMEEELFLNALKVQQKKTRRRFGRIERTLQSEICSKHLASCFYAPKGRLKLESRID